MSRKLKPEATKMEAEVNQMIQEEESQLLGAQFPDDPKISAEDILGSNQSRSRFRSMSGPEFSNIVAQATDEKIIDELLANLPNNRGYYLMLYKVLGHNEMEIKERIDNYSGWADVEAEITNIVRERTKKYPTRWGSGKYRLLIKCSKGMRGEKYQPIDFYIDALEPELPGHLQSAPNIDPMESAKAHLATMGSVVESIGKIMPQSINPLEAQKQNQELIMKMIEMGSTKGDGGMGAVIAAITQSASQNMQVMMQMMAQQSQQFQAMLTTLVGREKESKSSKDEMKEFLELLATMGIIGGKQNDILSTIKELTAIGAVKVGSEGPTEKLDEMKKLIGTIKDVKGLFGLGEATGVPESTLDKVLDHLGPHVPKLFDTVNNFLDTVKLKTAQTSTMTIESKPAIPGVGRNSSESGSGNTSAQPGQGTTHPSSAPTYQGPEMFRPLYEAVCRLDESYFPLLVTFMNSNGAEELIRSIGIGQVSDQQLIAVIQQYGGMSFKEQQVVTNLNWYAGEFVKWVKKQYSIQNPPVVEEPSVTTPTQSERDSSVATQPPPILYARCNKCGQRYEFEKEEWEQDNKLCDDDENGQECRGNLALLV